MPQRFCRVEERKGSEWIERRTAVGGSRTRTTDWFVLHEDLVIHRVPQNRDRAVEICEAINDLADIHKATDKPPFQPLELGDGAIWVIGVPRLEQVLGNAEFGRCATFKECSSRCEKLNQEIQAWSELQWSY